MNAQPFLIYKISGVNVHAATRFSPHKSGTVPPWAAAIYDAGGEAMTPINRDERWFVFSTEGIPGPIHDLLYAMDAGNPTLFRGVCEANGWWT